VASFDGRTQDRIRDNILAMAKKGDRGVVWIANRPAQAEPFEQIVVMQGGRIAAQGAPADLAARVGSTRADGVGDGIQEDAMNSMKKSNCSRVFDPSKIEPAKN